MNLNRHRKASVSLQMLFYSPAHSYNIFFMGRAHIKSVEELALCGHAILLIVVARVLADCELLNALRKLYISMANNTSSLPKDDI